MSEIPFDNLSDILKLLPVKSLLRFRCLSKAHCCLIDTPDFINLHLSHSNNTNPNNRLIMFETTSQHIKTYLMDLDSPEQHIVECDHPHNNTCQVFGSCNGLIALYHPQEGMFLWNPSTQKHQKLRYLWGKNFTNRSCDDYLLDGFGYDPVSDDYKLIRIRTIDRKWRKGSRGMVYSIKHNSCRRIEDFPYKCNGRRDCGTLVGSCLHWIVSEPGYSSDQLIFVLNLEDERYRALPIPGGLKKSWCKLGEVGGCLTLSASWPYVEIWVMKEYGNRDSWIRILHVYEPKMSFRPIRYSKTGDKLLSFYPHICQLWECDLKEEGQTSQVSQNYISNFNQQPPNVSDKRFRRIEVLGSDILYPQFSECCHYSIICVRSLVSVHV
ncbi:F-box protein CPR1-like [Mercurialis annua]|uniref:F-box protein CPR1-like n=1 Tax=Mercurialis annua TaxID=3986 RepID=UPI002160E286|nr:F-box protein CPR1-like [Mercurialis annua]